MAINSSFKICIRMVKEWGFGVFNGKRAEIGGFPKPKSGNMAHMAYK